MLDFLAVAALQGCDGKIKEHVQDLVEPAASSGLAEHKVKGIDIDLTSAGALAQEHHPGTSIANNRGHVSRPSNYQKEMAEEDRASISVDSTSTINYKMAAKTDDSGEISVDIAHSPQTPKKVIDLCCDQEMGPSRHESKLNSRNTSSLVTVTIDGLQGTTKLIDLSQDDDLDDGNLQQAPGQQEIAHETTTSGKNDFYGSVNYHGQISDRYILRNDQSSNNEGIVDLSQESDTKDLKFRLGVNMVDHIIKICLQIGFEYG